MEHLANQHPWGIELNAHRKRTGEKEWERVHNFPVTGIALTWFHMDPGKPLGDSWSVIFYYSHKFFSTKKISLNYRIGIGPGYIEKRFDIHNNYKNNLISSRLNYGLNGRINFTWQVHKHISLNLGIGLMHYSNGAMKVPNLGINIPSVHFGIGFNPKKEESQLKKDSIKSINKKRELNLLAAGGFKQVYPVGGPSWFASTVSGFISKNISDRSSLSIGTDFFYDRSSQIYVRSPEENPKYFRWGVTAGHEYLINRISLLTQFGIYLYDPLKREKNVYQRVALRYKIYKNTFAFMGLKTHFAQAEYVEWGAGVKF
jgi:hypothetical protein